MESAFTHLPRRSLLLILSEGSMLIYTGNIGSKLASGELFAYAEVLEMMKVLWEEVSRDQARMVLAG